VGVCVLPLALYSLRVPNAQDGYLADTARWLVAKDPQIGSARIVSGSSAKRVAFYTGSRWEYWPEQPEFYAALCRQLKAGGPGWLILETGTDYERAGNAELLAKLRADPQMAAWVGAVYERGGHEKRGDGRQVWAIRLVR
jgi:hypothetical protein